MMVSSIVSSSSWPWWATEHNPSTLVPSAWCRPLYFWARSQNFEKLLLVLSCFSFSLSVRPHGTNSASTRWSFMKFGISVFFEKLSIKVKFHWNLTRITGTLLEDRYTFMVISRSFLLRMRSTSEKNLHKAKTPIFMINIFFENRAIYEIKCKNLVESDSPQMSMWHLRVAG